MEWETFAGTFGYVADKMSKKELRDHAKQILEFIVQDVQVTESAHEIEAKSHGLRHSAESEQSASSTHGRMRFVSGFTLSQLIAEYRALRASVLKLWHRDCANVSPDSAQDTMRFNEAVDQSLAEAAVAYSDKLNEARETFIAILGHDLRSPLAATLTAGTYLSRPGAFSDQVQQIGVRLKRSAATMNGMVNDLLALARTQLGDGISIERQECDLLEMCQWAIEDANAAYPRAHFELNATGELIGKFDSPRLQQLLTNLASNAAQHGSPGAPVRVDIAGGDDFVRLTVHNQGAAIPADLLPTLFTSLVQLPQQENSVARRDSLGLGLFIAKQIAVAHGGDIDAASDSTGTTFTVEVPRH